jgi:hypothetical protein
MTINHIAKPDGEVKLYVKVINTIIINNQSIIENDIFSLPIIIFIVNNKTKKVIKTQKRIETVFWVANSV